MHPGMQKNGFCPVWFRMWISKDSAGLRRSHNVYMRTTWRRLCWLQLWALEAAACLDVILAIACQVCPLCSAERVTRRRRTAAAAADAAAAARDALARGCGLLLRSGEGARRRRGMRACSGRRRLGVRVASLAPRQRPRGPPAAVPVPAGRRGGDGAGLHGARLLKGDVTPFDQTPQVGGEGVHHRSKKGRRGGH